MKNLKSKIKSYNRKIKTNFLNNEILKECSQFICSSVIFVDSVFRTGKNYYPQVFSEEYKYVINEEKIPKYIIDDIEIPCDSNEENSNEKSLLEKIKMKKNSDYEENSDKEILKKKSDGKNF